MEEKVLREEKWTKKQIKISEVREEIRALEENGVRDKKKKKKGGREKKSEWGRKSEAIKGKEIRVKMGCGL